MIEWAAGTSCRRDACCDMYAQPDPVARLCWLRSWGEKEAEQEREPRGLQGGLLQPLQQDGPVGCHGSGEMEFHARWVPDHAGAGAQRLFAESAEFQPFTEASSIAERLTSMV